MWLVAQPRRRLMCLSRLACSGAFLAALLCPAARTHAQTTALSTRDFRFGMRQLPLAGFTWGGPIGALARNPTNANEVLAGSRSGGLFRSRDAGRTWTHVDSFPPSAISSVVYAPGFGPNTIFVSTRDDWHADNFGGVWRSSDGGATWTQIFSVPTGPQPAGFTPLRLCDPRPMAYGMSPGAGSQLYVATKCGIYLYDGSAFSLYRETASNLLTPFGNTHYAIQYLRSGEVVAGGETGLYYLDGAAFQNSLYPAGMTGADGNYRGGLADSPIGDRVVFATVFSTPRPAMLLSRDGGRHWDSVTGPPGAASSSCGGAPFVRVLRESIVAPDNLWLYHGDGCDVWRAGPFPGGDFSPVTSPIFQRAWRHLPLNHADPHSIELQIVIGDLLVASDGGIEICEPLSFTCPAADFRGAGSGLNAIEATIVTGQHILDFPHLFASPEYHLYLGTWHDDLWSSQDGVNWALGDCCETDYINGPRAVLSRDTSLVVYSRSSWTCAPLCEYQVGRGLFADHIQWPGAPDPLGPGGFVQVNGSVFSQLTGRTSPQAAWIAPGFNFGSTPAWTQIALLQDCGASGAGPCTALTFLDGLLHFGSYLEAPGVNPVMYGIVAGQRLASDGRTVVPNPGFAFFTNFLSVSAGVAIAFPTEPLYPAMCFRTCPPPSSPPDSGDRVRLGFNPSAGLRRPVFAVDPLFAGHILAPDVRNSQMVESFDGGDTWRPLPALTNLVTSHGALSFVVRNDPTLATEAWPVASAISFAPENPDLVLLGTLGNGVYFSPDRARTWQLVPFTFGIPGISAIHWKSASTAIIASAGRGLWELTLTPTALLAHLPAACPDCRFISLSVTLGAADPIFGGGVPVKDVIPGNRSIEDAVLIFDGRINKVVMGQTGLMQAGFSPGGAVVYYRTGQLEVPVEFSEQPKPGDLAGLPGVDQILQAGFLVRGFTFARGQLTGILFGPGFAASPSAEFIPTKTWPTSRTLGLGGQPYLSLGGPQMNGFSFPAGSQVTVRGQNFKTNALVKLSIDGGSPILQGVQPDSKGGFVVTFPLTLPVGSYTLIAEQSGQTLRFGVALNVTHADVAGQ